MNRALFALLLAACATTPPKEMPSTPASAPKPPPTRKVDVVETIHGKQVADPYRWLEDEKSSEVKSWMQAQDAYARAQLAALPQREALRKRLQELAYIDSMSAPEPRHGRLFFSRRKVDQEKAVVYVQDGAGAARALLDPNAWSKDGSVSLGTWVPSWDGKRVAYAVHQRNSDEATLHVIDVESGTISDEIEGAKYASPSWLPDGSGFVYTWLPPLGGEVTVADRPGFSEVRLHKLGTPPASDVRLRERTGDATSFQAVEVSREGDLYVLTISHGWTSNDLFVSDGKGPFAPIAVGHDAHFSALPHRGVLYVDTDHGAPLGKIVAIDPHQPQMSKWRDIVPERKDAKLSSWSIVGNTLAVVWEKDALTTLEWRSLDGKVLRQQQLPGLGTVTAPSGEPDGDDAFFTFQSYTYPYEIERTKPSTGETSRFFRVSAPVDPSAFVVDQIFATSKDGTRVPLFVVHRKDAKKDGSAPAILYGYGGFLSGLKPAFSPTMYAWLEQGGVYALANLRGGDEYGEEWHRAGMLLKKQNVFDDFFAASQALIQAGFTRADKLAVRGGSNGGLLVGAFVTQHPEGAAVALCGVPLLDMIRYDKFGSGRTWVSEYGSANDAQQFEALLAYSPYHHVTKGTRYPSTLLLSADADDRVDPMHARKFAAELQDATTGGPVLLRIEKNSGHGGADLVRATVEKLADEYAFALEHTR